MRKVWNTIENFMDESTEDHVGAYAAQAAFFLLLSLIPLLLLLLTLIQYTPVTKADVMVAVVRVFPKSFDSMIISIVNQVYNQSRAIIPLTALVAFWSAGRGVLAMTTGLNSVYDNKETRNYIFLRIRAALYTLLFIVLIVTSLILLVFGNSLSLFVNAHIPVLTKVMEKLIGIRTTFVFLFFRGFSMLMYRFLPNHKGGKKVYLVKQFPGAILTAIAWLVLSYFFSVYVDIFQGFANMYGSLTTIVLIMLWLYSCMYVMLLGGELNTMFEHRIVLKEKS